jgi:Na+/melibiose symporter-like transporter
VGLSAAETGLLLSISLASGAAIDILAAYLLRRAEGRLRQILNTQFLAGLATAAALVILFSPIRGLHHPFEYLVGAILVFRIAYGLYDTSQSALVSLLPKDDNDAHQYAVWRQTLGSMARLAVAALAFLLVGADAPSARREFVFAIAMAVIIVSTAAWLLPWRSGAEPVQVTPSRWRVATPRGLTPLLVAGMALAGPLLMIVRLAPFVGARARGEHAGAALLFALVLGMALGPLALPRPGGRESRAALAFTALTVTAAAIFLLDVNSEVVRLLAGLAHGAGLGGLIALLWRAVSKAIRDHAEQTGVRTDLVAFALVNATVKLSGAACGAGLALLLDGFKSDAITARLELLVIIAAGGICFLVATEPPLWTLVQRLCRRKSYERGQHLPISRPRKQ